MAYGTSDTHKQLKNDMPKSLVGLYASINQYLIDTFTALVPCYKPGLRNVLTKWSLEYTHRLWRAVIVLDTKA
jgi:hypothetical protein